MASAPAAVAVDGVRPRVVVMDLHSEEQKSRGSKRAVEVAGVRGGDQDSTAVRVRWILQGSRSREVPGE